jgi:hypothetical protein
VYRKFAEGLKESLLTWLTDGTVIREAVGG